MEQKELQFVAIATGLAVGDLGGPMRNPHVYEKLYGLTSEGKVYSYFPGNPSQPHLKPGWDALPMVDRKAAQT